jgi:hypothetical protein
VIKYLNNVVLKKYKTMIKILSCVNCEPIDSFTRIYPSETSLESLFSLYLGIPSIGCNQDILTLD